MLFKSTNLFVEALLFTGILVFFYNSYKNHKLKELLASFNYKDNYILNYNLINLVMYLAIILVSKNNWVRNSDLIISLLSVIVLLLLFSGSVVAFLRGNRIFTNGFYTYQGVILNSDIISVEIKKETQNYFLFDLEFKDSILLFKINNHFLIRVKKENITDIKNGYINVGQACTLECSDA